MIQGPIEQTTFIPSESSSGCSRCISWSAVVLPALVGVGLSFLLNIFTSGLGLSVFTLNPEGQLSLAVGGFVWLIVASYGIMFLVGWIAGCFVKPYRWLGVLHGFAAWCLALIVAAILFSQYTTNALGEPAYYSPNAPASISQPNVQPNTRTEARTEAASSPVAVKETVNKLGIGVLAIFFVFLAGALGSCTGGYVGGESKRREDELRR